MGRPDWFEFKFHGKLEVNPASKSMNKFLKSRTIQAALITVFIMLVTTSLIIYYQYPATQQTHFGSGDNITIQNQQIFTGSEPLPIDIREKNPILLKLTYQPPRASIDDQCNGTCVGYYIKIGEDEDFFYFDIPACKSSRVVGYNYDSGNGDEKIITDWQVEETRTCDWIAISKRLILNMEKQSNTTSTIKIVPNYKVIE